VALPVRSRRTIDVGNHILPPQVDSRVPNAR